MQDLYMDEALDTHMEAPEVVEDKREESPFKVGSCDFCDEKGVYVRELEDSWGIHIMDKCFYPCGDQRNTPQEPAEAFELVLLELIERSYCHDSKWAATIAIDGSTERIVLVRLNVESEARLHNAILACKNRNDIHRLNQYVFHN